MSAAAKAMASKPNSPGVFSAVFAAYAATGGAPITNEELYRDVSARTGMSAGEIDETTPIGAAGVQHSTRKRAARWTQQTMRQRGLLQRVKGQRGVWQLTQEGKERLTTVPRGEVLVAFSTRLGVALWADCRDAFDGLSERIHLVMTSPPYALAKQRAYGNPSHDEYVDWLCEAMAPVVRKLAPGGSLVLNLGNEVFVPGMPARSLIPERVTIAMHERLGLYKMDNLIWHNPSKPPGPVRYASMSRVQLNAGYEHLIWMTNDPARVMSDNRRVLQPHSERQQRLIDAGGERREVRNCDGAYTLRSGSYSKPTDGRIPRNVISMGHSCASQRAYKAAAKAAGLPAHGAPFPVALAKFFIEFLTRKGDLVADNMCGSTSLAVAAEELGRRWIVSDRVGEYLAGGALRHPNRKAGATFAQLFPDTDRDQLSLFGHEAGREMRT